MAALVLVLGACATLMDVQELQGDLTDEGFRDVTSTIEPGSPAVLVVQADAPADTTVEEAHTQAATVVWETFPRRFDSLRVTIDGDVERYSYDDLEAELGPRDAALDAGGDIGDDIERATYLTLATVGGIGLLVIAFVVVLTLVLVRRSRRRPAPLPPLRPWSPPPGATPTPMPSSAPVAPPGGWGTPPPAPPGADAPPVPSPTATPPPQWSGPATPGPAEPRTRPAVSKTDRRRHGRPFRGPLPDTAHTPPGWD